MDAKRRVGRKDVPGETNPSVYSSFRFEGLTPGQVDKYLKLSKEKEIAPLYLKDDIQKQMDSIWTDAIKKSRERNESIGIDRIERRRFLDRERRKRERLLFPERLEARRKRNNEYKRKAVSCPILAGEKARIQSEEEIRSYL